MKIKSTRVQTYLTIKNIKLIIILSFILFSCKKETTNNKIKNENKKIENEQIQCEIIKKITNIDSLDVNFISFFNIKKDSIKFNNSNDSGILSNGFGKRLVCNEINKNQLSSFVFYYPNNNVVKVIYEFHFKDNNSEYNFKNIEKELIRCGDRNNISNDLHNEFFDFMKRGLVFLLDKKNNTILIVEFNLFSSPKNHIKMTEFVELYKNKYEKILFVEGYTKFIKKK